MTTPTDPAGALSVLRQHLDDLDGYTATDLAPVAEDLHDAEELLANVRLALGEHDDTVPAARPYELNSGDPILAEVEQRLAAS